MIDGSEQLLCATCGLPLDAHDRHVRYRLPDPVFALADQERTAGTWLSHDDANQSVMMQVPHAGPFCRALFPVHLDGGYTVRFGVWVAIHPDELQRAFEIWWTPDYHSLELDGYLANALPKFGGLGASVRLEVLNPDHTPTVIHSESPQIAAALSERWHHHDLLPLLPA